MALIPLRARDGSVRAHALVDDVDYAELSLVPWYLGSRGYAMRQLHYRRPDGTKTSHAEFIHRRVLRLERGDPREADHINRDKLDNRRRNLRVVTRAENEQNKTNIRGASGVRGVHWNKSRGKWMARVTINGKMKHRCYFDTVDEAAAAAAALYAEHHPYRAQP
jgi:hypothetical protein